MTVVELFALPVAARVVWTPQGSGPQRAGRVVYGRANPPVRIRWDGGRNTAGAASAHITTCRTEGRPALLLRGRLRPRLADRLLGGVGDAPGDLLDAFRHVPRRAFRLRLGQRDLRFALGDTPLSPA